MIDLLACFVSFFNPIRNFFRESGGLSFMNPNRNLSWFFSIFDTHILKDSCKMFSTLFLLCSVFISLSELKKTVFGMDANSIMFHHRRQKGAFFIS